MSIKVYKQGVRIVAEQEGQFFNLAGIKWDDILTADNSYSFVSELIGKSEKVDSIDLKSVDAPIGSQEIWASGVTYKRSKQARMEESDHTGGAVFYDKVYDADRPEIFFKATSERAVGHGDVVNIRRDSEWDVPEPELTLAISSTGTIQGFTIGNDMSSRNIEAENPLYLPQAKMYDRSAAIGPCLLLVEDVEAYKPGIKLEIYRNDALQYADTTSISQMKRSFSELIQYLFAEMTYDKGVYLMTGTCLVPPDEFTLQVGDVVHVTIEGIGTLTNTIGSRPSN